MSNKPRTDQYQLVEISVTELMYKMKSHSINNVLSKTLNPKTNLAGPNRARIAKTMQYRITLVT